MKKKPGLKKKGKGSSDKQSPSASEVDAREDGAGLEGHLDGLAGEYAEALEWKTGEPLEVHCDFISTVDNVLKLAGSTRNPAGLILVDPGRPMKEIPGATHMGPDLAEALSGGEVRESFGALPQDHFAVAVIGCSQDDLSERARGLLMTCKAVGMKVAGATRPPRVVAFHIACRTQLNGKVLLRHAERTMDHLEPGQDFTLVPYLAGEANPPKE